jgi:fucose 4-O-acetylase-like acetyltransferase
VNRINFLDFAKGILIILVVIGHSVQFLMYGGSQAFFEDPLFKAIYMFHMPLFMAISGFLSYGGIQRGPFLKFSLKKTYSYIVPIFAWSITFVLPLYLFGKGLPNRSIFEAIWREFFGGNLWFFWALLGCLLLTALVKKMGRYFYLIYPLSFFAVLCLPDHNNLVYFKFMYPFFQSGYLIASRWPMAMGETKKIAIVMPATVVAAVSYGLWSHSTYIYTTGMLLSNGNWSNVLLRYVGGFSASVVALFLIYRLSKLVTPKVNQLVSNFGRDSIYIYIIQGYVMRAMIQGLARLHIDCPEALLGLGVAAVFGCIVSYICWQIGSILALNRPFAKVFFGRLK